MKIRRLTVKDVPSTMPLIEQFWNYLNGLHTAQGKDFDLCRARRVLVRTMSCEGHFMYGAFLGKRMVGFTDFWILPDFFHGGNILNIQDLFVVEGMRGKGVGKALFDRTLQVARQKKVVDIHVEVLDENVLAQRFYEKVGLREKMLMVQGQVANLGT